MRELTGSAAGCERHERPVLQSAAGVWQRKSSHDATLISLRLKNTEKDQRLARFSFSPPPFIHGLDSGNTAPPAAAHTRLKLACTTVDKSS